MLGRLLHGQRLSQNEHLSSDAAGRVVVLIFLSISSPIFFDRFPKTGLATAQNLELNSKAKAGKETRMAFGECDNDASQIIQWLALCFFACRGSRKAIPLVIKCKKGFRLGAGL